MTGAILQAINGVSLAALLFLLASGFTLSFGLMRVVNMAHGAYYLLGGYVGLAVALKTGSFALALVPAAPQSRCSASSSIAFSSAAPARTISRRCCSRSASRS